MQLTQPNEDCSKVTLVTFGLVLLMVGGCSQGSADAAAGGTSTAGASSSLLNYELVLATRPEQLDLYYKHIKPFYELCAAAALELKVPVKPFLTIPADFVAERRTIVTDGKNRMDKTESSGLGGPNPTLDPQTGCVTNLGTSSVTQLTFDGKRQNVTVANDGSSQVSPIEVLIEAPAAKPPDIKDYSVRKIVLGISVRCLSANNPVISNKVLLEACVFDGAGDSTLLDDEGKAVLVYSRQASPVRNSGIANTLVTEPVKVSVGKPVDSGVFRFQGSQK